MTNVQTLTFPNGKKIPLAFSDSEYQSRLNKFRKTLVSINLEAVLLTSIHAVAYYTGFIYCSFGRPYAAVVTGDRCVVISANIDGGQPWRRSISENLIYTDWEQDNFFRAVEKLLKDTEQLGIEFDHCSIGTQNKISLALKKPVLRDVTRIISQQRMFKSKEEIDLIKSGARIADLGGTVISDCVRPGVREFDVATAGRNAVENAIAEAHPYSELRDSWVWFQSGINTDGAHNPVTCRILKNNDILSLNIFPMISGYYTALERTLFLGTPDNPSLNAWEANIKIHQRGIQLIKPGAKCSDITFELNGLLKELGYLEYRSFGYGHSFGILCHYYGREGNLELREDIDTILEPGMVISMEPMIRIPEGQPGAGGYREHDILIIGQDDTENITNYPIGPENNIIYP